MEKNDKPINRSSGGLMFIKPMHLKRPYCCKMGCRGCTSYYGKLPEIKKKGQEPTP